MEKGKQWVGGITRYFSSRNLSVALLGFSSGLPILMTLSTLSYWLAAYDIDKANIGYFASVGLPYALKPLWAPFLDLFQLPIFKKLGRRKGWIVFFQIFIALIFFLLSFVDPTQNLSLVVLLIFLLAFFSASHDIVVDAYRIDYLEENEQASGASSYLFMYRIAMLLMGAGVLALSDQFEWAFIFQGVSLVVLFVICLTLFIPEPIPSENQELRKYEFENPFMQFFNALLKFFQREKAGLIILLIICFKLPDAVFGMMANPFYKEMGYSGTEIGAVTKVYGLVATLLGTFVAAAVVNFIGLYRSLLISIIMIGLTNLGYLLIIAKPNLSMLMFAISAENFIVGFASVLFIMFLGLLCDRNASATQYALLSAASAIGVRVFGLSSGVLANGLGWEGFFIATAFLFIPSLILIIILKPQIQKLKVLN